MDLQDRRMEALDACLCLTAAVDYKPAAVAVDSKLAAAVLTDSLVVVVRRSLAAVAAAVDLDLQKSTI